MPRKQQQIHYGVCEHCEGTGIKQFFQKVGNFLKPVGKALKPIVRPLANELINVGSTALKDVAPEYSGAINVGERVLSNSVDRGLASKGYGVKRKGRFAKGSQEAKDHMARIRAMRGKGIGGQNGIRRMTDNVVMMPQPHSRLP
jgi:hypothetical protein